jgi:hypothetical protein
MRFGSTLILAGLAVLLGGYVYFIDLPKAEREKQEETEARRLVDFKRDDVKAVELPLEGGGRARLVREGTPPAWKLVEPLQYGVDESTISGILNGVERLEKEFEMDAPSDPGRLGLDDAQSLKIEPDEGEPLVLTLGSDTPVGGQRYVRFAGRRSGIYGVRKAQTEGLTTNLFKLRDKAITRLDPETVQGIEVRSASGVIARAERVAGSGEAGTAGGWKLQEPIQEKGDAEQLQRLAQSLYFARATAFVDQPESLETYGLKSPEVEVALRTASATERFKLGRAEGKFYVQVDDRTPIFEVPERLQADVPRELFAYRDKRVLTLPERTADRVELLFPRDGEQYVFVRDGTDAAWRLDRKDQKLMDPGKVEDLLFELYTLNATALVEKPDRAALGLEPPAVRVSVSGAGKALGWLEIGDGTEEIGLAAASSQSDRTWRVRSDLKLSLPLSSAALRQDWPIGPTEPAPAAPAGTNAPAPAGAPAPAAPANAPAGAPAHP